MKVLITGSSGILGSALCRRLIAQHAVFAMDTRRVDGPEPRPEKFIECDITDKEKTTEIIISVKPDVVIHAAAFTDVNGCQSQLQKSEQVNIQGAQTISLAAQQAGAFLFFLSTDYVFDGKKPSGYIESDKTGPINVYGQAKLAGERYIESVMKRFAVVRTSWLFGLRGKNFVDTMIANAQVKKSLSVVNDQFGSPTYAPDLAAAIHRLIGSMQDIRGIYHITNSGSLSWYEFALAIKELAGLNTQIIPVSSAQFASVAPRPRMSILENRRYQEFAGEKLRSWKEALKEYLDERAKINTEN